MNNPAKTKIQLCSCQGLCESFLLLTAWICLDGRCSSISMHLGPRPRESRRTEVIIEFLAWFSPTLAPRLVWPFRHPILGQPCWATIYSIFTNVMINRLWILKLADLRPSPQHITWVVVFRLLLCLMFRICLFCRVFLSSDLVIKRRKMENPPLIDDFPQKHSIYSLSHQVWLIFHGFSHRNPPLIGDFPARVITRG